MVRKYFKNEHEGQELLKMIKNNFKESSLNKVLSYERAYANQQIEEIKAENQQQIAQKNEEIAKLRKKLKENGIE